MNTKIKLFTIYLNFKNATLLTYFILEIWIHLDYEEHRKVQVFWLRAESKGSRVCPLLVYLSPFIPFFCPHILKCPSCATLCWALRWISCYKSVYIIRERAAFMKLRMATLILKRKFQYLILGGNLNNESYKW